MALNQHGIEHHNATRDICNWQPLLRSPGAQGGFRKLLDQCKAGLSLGGGRVGAISYYVIFGLTCWTKLSDVWGRKQSKVFVSEWAYVSLLDVPLLSLVTTQLPAT